MKEITNWGNIQEAGNYANLPVGAYVCKIIEVKDVTDKNYLEVHFDIDRGPHKDYFSVLQQVTGKDRGISCRSYSEKALPFFKQFIVAVEKSNPGYNWNWDERTLTGKIVVINFREEEFIDQSNEVRTNVKPFEFRSLEAFEKGEVKIAAKKELSDADKARVYEAHRVPGDLSVADSPF